MNFKYNSQLQLIRKEYNIDCPCKDAMNINTITYRWVYDDITNEANFIPSGIRNPRKFPPGRIENKCNQFALSMFETEEQGIKYFHSFKPRLRRKLGYTHIAKGYVNHNDGLANPSDEQGHFGFHEYEKVELTHKFEIINSL